MVRAALLLIVLATAALAACGDGAGPQGGGVFPFVTIGQSYVLRRVNGQPIPWSTPPADSQYISMTIVEGAVTFVSNSLAQREEHYGRWVIAPNGMDSTWIAGGWMHSASVEPGPGRVVLTYLGYTPGAIGPSQRADTLLITLNGTLILRHTGFIPPLDSMVRVYCKTPAC